MKTLIWLDDARDPFSKEIDWMVFSPIGRDVRIVWVVSYKEFTEHINRCGLPDGICFDHDLNGIMQTVFREKGKTKKESRRLAQSELTGYNCAEWLIEYCDKNKLEIPKWNIQSANPAGKERIKKLLEDYELDTR